jgi:hypothetical protein
VQDGVGTFADRNVVGLRHRILDLRPAGVERERHGSIIAAAGLLLHREVADVMAPSGVSVVVTVPDAWGSAAAIVPDSTPLKLFTLVETVPISAALASAAPVITVPPWQLGICGKFVANQW